ncbi:MAG: MFS transporter [Polyangiaceae bacterium]|nr:MFS transporter [Polyangiaceae bacterium]
MRKASLGTIVLTVFLDLLGFGLVVPFLPGVARSLDASSFQATLVGAAYSLMQLLFVPFWGHLSDRTGRRPILVTSIAASAVGMLILANATSLWMIFAARIWSGIATSNIAVAPAYIADVTSPEERSRGMGLIGAGIGFGFVLGPVIGGTLEAVSPLGRAGALPAYAAAGLSLVNLALALRFLPESLAPEDRGRRVRSASPFDAARVRAALEIPGVGAALLVNFVVVLSFAGLEQTFRLFTEDAFHMDTASTSYVLGLVGIILIAVQGGLLRPLSRVAGERARILAGVGIQSIGFLGVAASPRLGVPALYGAMSVVAFGSALVNPSLSAFVSRCSDARRQGTVLGVLQSAGALARVCGPAVGGVLYQHVGVQGPYVAASIGMIIAGAFALRLPRPAGPRDPGRTSAAIAGRAGVGGVDRAPRAPPA